MNAEESTKLATGDPFVSPVYPANEWAELATGDPTSHVFPIPGAGYYAVVYGRLGWEWQWHKAGVGGLPVIGGQCRDVAACKLACEEHRELTV